VKRRERERERDDLSSVDAKKYREIAVDASNTSFKTLSFLSGREKKKKKKKIYGLIVKMDNVTSLT